MLIVKIGEIAIAAGDTVEIMGGPETLKFLVLEVLRHSFKVKCLVGNIDNVNNIPHSLFGDIGQTITVVEVSDKTDDPNRAFIRKKGVF